MHEADAIEQSIHKAALIEISILKSELTLSPNYIMSPLAREEVSIVKSHWSKADLEAVLEISFVPVSSGRNEHSMPIHFIFDPEAVIKWSVWKKHLSLSTFLILKPLSIVDRTILIIVHALPVPHDFANVFSPVKIEQLVFHSLRSLDHRNNYVFYLLLVWIGSS